MSGLASEVLEIFEIFSSVTKALYPVVTKFGRYEAKLRMLILDVEVVRV